MRSVRFDSLNEIHFMELQISGSDSELIKTNKNEQSNLKDESRRYPKLKTDVISMQMIDWTLKVNHMSCDERLLCSKCKQNQLRCNFFFIELIMTIYKIALIKMELFVLRAK